MACKTFTIEPAMDGLRAETVLRRYMPQLQDADVRNIFSHRDVKLDGVRIRPDARVHSGQTVTVYYMQGEKQALDIIYEDDDVLLVNKRPGISVEPDNGGGTCMTQLALEHVGGSFPPVPCHRLDNQTCGLLLFAKNLEHFSLLFLLLNYFLCFLVILHLVVFFLFHIVSLHFLYIYYFLVFY